MIRANAEDCLDGERQFESNRCRTGHGAGTVFYVTDLMGAKISSPTRNAAVKRVLIGVFGLSQEAGARRAAAQ